MQMSSSARCGWYGSIAHFLVLQESTLLQCLEAHHLNCMLESPSASQIVAWKHCFALLQRECHALKATCPSAAQWTMIFEFELPRERGRRPDVVLLAHSTVVVLEFKDFASPRQAHLDQTAAYARDLRHYHAASHHLNVLPILIPTAFVGSTRVQDEVWIVPPNQLAGMLDRLVPSKTEQPLDPVVWLAADYAPLPSLVTAARTIFQHEPLPQIRRAQSAGIPETIAGLVAIAKTAQARGERHLALVTGVPGAGKTLVGLQFVYENHFDDQGSGRTAVLLSGNGPLVKVLQYTLRSSVFVQDVHGFLKQYGGLQQSRPEEHIWVYDEAQRAWDAARVQEKRGHGLSEPEDFLRIGERMDGWALMVGLIGEGQEIHLGEEAGLAQWNAAIASSTQPWIVHCPAKVAAVFPAAAEVEVNEALNLTVSLRSHLAEDVQDWVKHLLDGQLQQAAVLSERINAQGFELYITRDVAVAKSYVQERYQGQQEKRYGLLASSKAKNLTTYGIRNEYNFTKNFREGPWYADSPDAPNSCCQLREVATEFACQGLELDFPIVCWGSDLLWGADHWQSLPQPRSKARDPHQLRLNSYRVLLTRGRDGMVLFVPQESALEATYRALVAAGCRVLEVP